jgi:adenine phosphoribosyltransferase
MKYRSVEQILREHIAEIKDFPSPGIIFRDLTPILADSKIFTLAIDELYLRTMDLKYDVILSPESRGF